MFLNGTVLNNVYDGAEYLLTVDRYCICEKHAGFAGRQGAAPGNNWACFDGLRQDWEQTDKRV